MSNVKSCLLVGVGGQGAILISKIMSNGFMKAGYDVKQSEVHGMAQRGGSVSTQVRWGDKVRSPIVDKGEADCVVSFELLEAARYLPLLRKGGLIVSSSQTIDPMPVITGAAQYPSGLPEKIAALGAVPCETPEQMVAELEALVAARVGGRQTTGA